MADFQDQKAATPKTTDLDDDKLLGFEHIEATPAALTSAEDAVGLALNKRGEGPVMVGPPHPIVA